MHGTKIKYSKKKPIIGLLILLLVGFQFLSCLTAGTHGSIESYTFPVSKNNLQKAVDSVISSSVSIKVAPITDSFTSKYYNDGVRYVTIQIEEQEEINEYTFQYSGTEEYWDTSKNSDISIVYAFDKNNNGGSEGNGNLSSYKSELKEKLIRIF